MFVKRRMAYLFGFKSIQTQAYDANGFRVPVTHVKMDPATVVGYNGENRAKVAFGNKKHPSKPLLGLLKNLSSKITPRFLREIEINKTETTPFEVGTKINLADFFVAGDKIKVTGTMKGKGFQGVVRRYGFKGAPQTHGTSTKERHPGSIGQTTTPGRVYKGKRMGGHMGTTTVSIKGLQVFEVKPEENLLVVQGLIPGAKGGLVKITKLV